MSPIRALLLVQLNTPWCCGGPMQWEVFAGSYVCCSCGRIA